MLQAFLDGAVFGASSGEGPARALLLHGWRRTHEDFAVVATALADRGIPSVALDLAGFGATPPPSRPMGARGYAAALAPLVAELAAAAGPVVVVGHSFGGRVGVCLAAGQPGAVGGLVLSGVPLVRSAMPAARPSWRYRGVRHAARLHLVPAARLEAARRRHGSEDYRVATGVMRDVLVATVGESYEDELARVRCGLTLVWGERDATAPLSVAQAARALVPTARLEVLDGIGHLVPTQSPASLVEATTALLEGAR